MLLARQLIGARPAAIVAAVVACIAIGWIDEIPTRSMARSSAAAFRQQRAFFDRLQAAVAPGTAVYELPYTFFPEGGNKAGLGSYDLVDPYAFTRDLRWSAGEMHGRVADQWNEQISTLGGADLIAGLARAGFGAIYIDRRGYTDRGAAVDRSLTAALGAPFLEDEARNVAVYRIQPSLASTGAPFVVVGPGRNWYPWAANTKGSLEGWSRGSADLIVGNPNHATLPLDVEFELSSAQERVVHMRYADMGLGSYALRPGVAQKVTLRFDAAQGVSRLELGTDTPAVQSSKDQPKRAFRIGDLTYGPVPGG
jgi:phosphoglycerol transferase